MMKKTPSFFYTKIIIISWAMFLLGMFFWHPIFLSSERQEADFPEIRQIIEKYHQAPSEQKIKDSFIHAYVTAYGDKYTQYFSPEEVLSFQTMIDGDFEGIGAYVEDDANGIYISGVLPGSPAQQAGLIPGDIIQAVDGETMHAKTANEAVIKIRGPAGSPVVLDIFSTVMGTKKQVTILRRHLEIPVIKDEIRDGVLVIQLFSFNDHSRDDVAQVLQKNKGKYNAILLDLRNNGGGTLQSAVDVASLFLSTGKVIATVDENLWQSIAPSLQENVERYVSHGTEDIKTPFYILTNGQTASAAEILASALHFYLKAPIFGSQTYGKWSVQQIFPLSNWWEIKVTIAHWYTADNVLLDGTGLTPTTVVLPTVDDITQWNDGQLKSTISQIVHALPSQK